MLPLEMKIWATALIMFAITFMIIKTTKAHEWPLWAAFSLLVTFLVSLFLTVFLGIYVLIWT